MRPVDWILWIGQGEQSEPRWDSASAMVPFVELRERACSNILPSSIAVLRLQAGVGTRIQVVNTPRRFAPIHSRLPPTRSALAEE